jgi:hypothetical protein
MRIIVADIPFRCARACPAKAGRISGQNVATPPLDVALRMLIVADSHAARFSRR